MPKEVILRTDHLFVVAQDQDPPTETVFVTFNAMGAPVIGDAFWGESFFRKEGVAAIGVMTLRPNWYPAADVAAVAAAINARTRGRRVVTYGFSQGGYGALRFGRALNASCAIAFSPQFSIDPAVVGEFDRRYLSYHRAALDNGAAIAPSDLCATNYVYFDPRLAIDGRHLAMITAAGDAAGARVVPVITPFLGHESFWIVTEGGMGPGMVKAFCDAKPPERTRLRALVRACRGRSATYQRARLQWLLERPAASGSRLREWAVAATTQPSVKALAELCVLLESGERGTAEARLQALGDEALRDALPLHWSWKYFRERRFPVGELRIAGLLADGTPPNPLLRLYALNSYIFHGRRGEAERLFDEISKMSGAEALREQLQWYGELLGR